MSLNFLMGVCISRFESGTALPHSGTCRICESLETTRQRRGVRQCCAAFEQLIRWS